MCIKPYYTIEYEFWLHNSCMFTVKMTENSTSVQGIEHQLLFAKPKMCK